ncbi:hypothetical protein TNCT_664531 [Trichonephila clavata]|uniref:Uncharacterized protein n=1 Tax=Trichonephila clavata TaxID=2740835 RepID=A0A8X6KNU3_TRICU|nr:hypothetical protein TNCT_664531 [Trichonephila clavata]
MNGHTNGVTESRGKKSLVDIIASDTRCVWNKKVENTEMDKFRGVINKKYDLKLSKYPFYINGFITCLFCTSASSHLYTSLHAFLKVYLGINLLS